MKAAQQALERARAQKAGANCALHVALAEQKQQVDAVAWHVAHRIVAHTPSNATLALDRLLLSCTVLASVTTVHSPSPRLTLRTSHSQRFLTTLS